MDSPNYATQIYAFMATLCIYEYVNVLKFIQRFEAKEVNMVLIFKLNNRFLIHRDMDYMWIVNTYEQAQF